jgi:3-dehydroquinate dehydratase type I
MKIHYCLPIIKKSKNDVLQTIKKYSNDYQFFEVWLEEIEDLDDAFIKELADSYKNKLIILFQRGTDKNTHMDEKRKEQIISILNNTHCYLDLDISESKEIDYLKKNTISIKTIISYHNYDQTPLDLGETIKKMDQLNPTIYKISTQCNDETDALKLLLLQQNLKNQQKKHIVLGMGNLGKLTRVFGTLWGNELIYAPVTETEASAPGQLTKQTLEEIFQRLL